MIKEILKNEIKDLIGHAPSDAEFKSALDYLSDNVEEYHKLEDVKTWLYNWRDDEMLQCRACGDYFIPEDMIRNDYGDFFCSSDCEIEFEKEQEYKSEHQRELISTWNE